VKASKFVILGGGMVAGYAAKQLAELGLKPGDLTIVSAEHSVPYERPPLSKGFLAGRNSEESICIVPNDFYSAHGIDLRLATEVTGVASAEKRVHLRSGEELAFDKLILATGSRVRTLEVAGANLARIFYLRSMDDSKRIRGQAETAKRAAVIGGGFIAMEVASVLAQKGIEVVMVVREARVFPQLFSPEMSASSRPTTKPAASGSPCRPAFERFAARAPSAPSLADDRKSRICLLPASACVLQSISSHPAASRPTMA
jgi:NADPH-dependent 2,4-dienoyl-CoA reductase/sulfur reductase-like enzyme